MPLWSSGLPAPRDWDWATRRRRTRGSSSVRPRRASLRNARGFRLRAVETWSSCTAGERLDRGRPRSYKGRTTASLRCAETPSAGGGRIRATGGRGRYSVAAFTSLSTLASGTRYKNGATSAHRSVLRTGTGPVRGGADRSGRDSVGRPPALHVLHRTERDGLSAVRAVCIPSRPSRALALGSLWLLHAFCLPRSAHASAQSTHRAVSPPRPRPRHGPHDPERPHREARPHVGLGRVREARRVCHARFESREGLRARPHSIAPPD